MVLNVRVSTSNATAVRQALQICRLVWSTGSGQAFVELQWAQIPKITLPLKDS